MTLLESLTRQHSNQTQQNYVMENQRIECHQMPLFNIMISGGLAIPNLSMKIDQCFDHNLSSFGDCRLNGADEFAGDKMSFTPTSEIATNVNHSFSLNSSCSPATVSENTVVSNTGGDRLRKRKAEFSAIEDSRKDNNMIEGESGDWESEVTAKSNRETSASTSKENSKHDYIHVRARRGQATDSHSLAERARREKISKKMKCLQDLVPGCNKVTGKAGMLEEIINYVQSLQKQVEFLSMKLATCNQRLDFNNMDDFLLKELTAASHSEMANLAYLQLNQAQQGGTSTCGTTGMLMNCTQMAPQRTASSSMPFPEAFIDSSCFPQVQSLPAWETDLQSVYKGEFH